MLGIILFWASVYTCFAILYLIFISRIQLIFDGSIYAYKPWIYKTFYIIIILNWLFSTVNIIIWEYQNPYFNVLYDKTSGIAFCYNMQPKAVDAGVSLTVTAINVILNVSFLCMFNRGLWLLNKEMINRYLQDKNLKQCQSATPIPTMSPSTTVDLQPTHLVDNISQSTTTSEDMKIIVDRYHVSKSNKDGNMTDESLKRIIELYNLMKKQTILVCIAVISTTLLGFGAAMDLEAVKEFGWDFGLNVICVWMMLSTSKRYWNCCRDYGLCKCCYLKTGNR